ncbi:hypothetical protein C8F04DRAFT_1272371 [Mycena alexandri]|uniref:Uncharacterized protein n=1 Tax=Mycena alexandri TaxID=1745969 RepID=A0AAD6S867_9AGAR|nr:hypothetical protein C8F04DRAFT_1272371 [Mycena alexandri]
MPPLSSARHDPLALILSSWMPLNKLQTKRTFDAAVAPILNELFQISGCQPVTVQQIFDVAREAQRTTQDFAVAFEKRRAEEEGKIVEIFEGEIVRVLSTLPEDVRRRLSQSAVTSTLGTSAVDVAAITAHADRIETPVLDHQRGRVVTRNLFSSSSPPLTHESSSIHIPYSTKPHQPSAPYDDWSPRISEWALLSGTKLNDSLYDDLPIRFAPRPSRLPEEAETVTDQLYRWAYEARISKRQFLTNLDTTACAPFQDALAKLHGPLSQFLDYAYMSVHEHSTLLYLPPLPNPTDDPGLSSPDAMQCPTSLDWSLPDSDRSDPPSPTKLTAENLEHLQKEDGGPPHSKVAQKAPRTHFSKFHGNELRQSVLEHEAYRATGLTEPQMICAVTGCRVALMEGIYHVDILLWNHSSVHLEVRDRLRHIEEACSPWFSTHHPSDYAEQVSFPKTYKHHPFLSDYDAARAHTQVHTLQRLGFDELAKLLRQLLVLRFRDNIVITKLFNAGHLEEQYPEALHRAWDLLHRPDADADSGMPDLDDYELEYPADRVAYEHKNDKDMEDASNDNDYMDVGSLDSSDYLSYCGSACSLARHSI